MERRRLQFTGGTSYTVTLPKDWIISNGLAKNDPVYVSTMGDGALVVRPYEPAVSSALSSTTIEADRLDRDTLYRRIIGSYVSGYSEIRIESAKGISQDVLELAKGLSDSLMGMNVCDASSSCITLKDFSDITEISPKMGIGRMKVAMRNILNDICNNMKLGIHMGTLQNRDTEVDRIRLLISRQASILQASPSLYGKMGLDPRVMSTMVSLAALIEDIGDVCVSMNNTLKGIRDRAAIEDIARIMEDLDLTGLFVTVADSVLSRSLEAAEDSIKVCRSAIERMGHTYEVSAKYDLSDALAVNTLAESMRKILGFESDICELAIDVSVGVLI